MSLKKREPSSRKSSPDCVAARLHLADYCERQDEILPPRKLTSSDFSRTISLCHLQSKIRSPLPPRRECASASSFELREIGSGAESVRLSAHHNNPGDSSPGFFVSANTYAALGKLMKRIQIYDTTLRDGSQGEGINFSL